LPVPRLLPLLTLFDCSSLGVQTILDSAHQRFQSLTHQLLLLRNFSCHLFEVVKAQLEVGALSRQTAFVENLSTQSPVVGLNLIKVVSQMALYFVLLYKLVVLSLLKCYLVFDPLEVHLLHGML
jgi:hypothetical protein